ncbi:MAG TPA: hypothetical protein VIC04_10730 [Terriglobia bacterium]|jgi:hypothetical protein
MLRRLATLALLIPLSLNGLWLVCADGQAAAAPPKSAQTASESTVPCKHLCPIQKPQETGAICLLTGNADGAAIALFAVAVATPPVPEPWFVSFTLSQSESEPAPIYSEPSLSGLAPPPEA